jgi:hypothetical protein
MSPRNAFARPSTAPDFLKAQDALNDSEQTMLAKLRGDATEAKPARLPRGAKEDRSHRTTVWLSPVVQRRIRIRALERGQTVSAYLLELLARDGITDAP